MEGSQKKDYNFLGNDTLPNLYDALVYEREFKSEYLERQIYEPFLKSEPFIVKLIENKSDLSNLSTLSEPSIVKLSRIKATRRSRRARGPSRIRYIYAISRSGSSCFLYRSFLMMAKFGNFRFVHMLS